jgi:hypothetical protein
MGLADLNTYSEEQIVFTDNRDATVLFLVPVPVDLEETKNSLIFNINNPYKIDEIIRPEVCLPTLSVNPIGLSGTTVAWATIPAGSTVTESNGVYTIDNIVDADTYEIVKNPTITVPSSFQGTFAYIVSVNYTTAAGSQTYAWQVNTDIPVAQLISTSAVVADALRLKSLESTLVVNSVMDPVDLAVEIEPAEFNITAGLTASVKVSRNVGLAPILPEFSLQATAEKIQPWQGFDISPYVNINDSRELFYQYSLPESQADLLGNWTSIRQVVTVDSGRVIHGYDAVGGFSRSIGTSYDSVSNPSDSFHSSGYSTFDATTFRANYQSGNPVHSDPLVGWLYYVPEYNYVGLVDYNFKVYVDGVLRTNYDGVIRVGSDFDGTQNANLPETIIDLYRDTYSPNSTKGDWKPSAYAAELHNRLDIYIVGGGGAGAGQNLSNPGGGDGGDITIISGITLTDTTSFSYSFGAGGIGSDNSGTSGTASTVTINGVTYTANGGSGGSSNSGPGANGANYANMPSAARVTFASYAGQGNIISVDPSRPSLYPGVHYTYRGAGGYPSTIDRGAHGSAGIIVTKTYRV